MDHRIKLKIADRSYRQVIHTEEEEACIRQAAQNVNERLAHLSSRYAGVSVIDILTIAALNESIEKVEMQKRLSDLEAEIASMSSVLDNYVKSLK